MIVPTWQIDQLKILTRGEIVAVLADLRRRGQRSPNARVNLIIFRLACCCGLRVSEIAGLRLDDVRLASERPHLRIRKETAKGRRGRRVPLWWDAGTLDDITAWKGQRLADGAAPSDPFVASPQTARRAKPFSRFSLRRRFRTACKVLGLERLEDLTIHHGRHTFISLALAGGRSLAEVRDAAGHGNVATTSTYLHVAAHEVVKHGDVFGAP